MKKTITLKELERSTETRGGFRAGTVTEITYECPCGNGKVYYENDDTVGFKYRAVTTDCKMCVDKYEFKKGLAIEK